MSFSSLISSIYRHDSGDVFQFVAQQVFCVYDSVRIAPHGLPKVCWFPQNQMWNAPLYLLLPSLDILDVSSKFLWISKYLKIVFVSLHDDTVTSFVFLRIFCWLLLNKGGFHILHSSKIVKIVKLNFLHSPLVPGP